ncbi:MAG: nucleoside-diphosphate kinase [bacterium]
MMNERTLAIVKPDAVAKNSVGGVLARAEGAGLRLIAGTLLQLSPEDAGRFYVVHKERPFYKDLCAFMSSGPVFVAAFEGEGAIGKWRDTMGATDPAKAAAGTVRKDFGTNVERNASHGSDAPDTARWEIAFFFGELELRG